MIDSDKLPRRLLFDTGVLLRALRHKPGDPRSPLCQALLDAVLKARTTKLLIAAPSITEITRGTSDPGAEPREVPRERHVVVVPFDQTAAVLLGHELPYHMLQTLNVEGYSASFLKYDALIVGCALRWKADAIVSLDTKMATRFGHLVPILMPTDYEDPQMDMLLVPRKDQPETP